MALSLSVDMLCGAAIPTLGFKAETLAVFLLGAAVFIVLVSAIFLWNRTLRIRVEQKTTELERRAAEIKELNEQLRISNEELQTSNEEYESANEELQLLNEDLNKRNAELAETTEQMRALKDFNDKVIAAVPSALLVVDLHLKILSANDKYYSTFPDFLEKAEGTFLSDALPHSLLYEYDIVRRIQDVIQTSTTVRFPGASYADKHNVQHFADIHICPVAAEPRAQQQPSNVLLVITDVTEMKRLEKEITARERYLRNLVNNSIVAIMATDSEARFTLFNEGTERLLGLSSERMGGASAGRVFCREADFHEIVQRVNSEGKVEDYETEFVGRGGEKIQVSLFATSLRNEKEELIGYLIIAVDIRERKRAEHNLIQRNKELSTLYAVGHTLGSATAIDQRLPEVAGEVCAAFGCQVCAIAVCSPGETLRVGDVYSAGVEHVASEEVLDRMSEIMIGRLQSQREPIFGASILEDADLSKTVTDVQENGSFISVPLSAGTEMIGAITIFKLDRPALRLEDAALLSSIAQRTAMALENEKLYAREKQNVSRLRALVNATRVIGSILDPEGVLEALTGQVLQIVACRCAAVFSHDPEAGSLSVVTARAAGRVRGLKRGVSFPAGGTCVANVLDRSKPCSCAVDDTRQCTVKQAVSDPEIRSNTCLPMALDGSRGLLALGQGEHNPLSDAETHILSDLVSHASLSVKNAQLYTALQTAYGDLKRAQDAMVKAEKYRAIGELSAGVAHDFNNALSIILGRAQFLMGLTQDDVILKGLKSIENACKDAAGTVRRMQRFSKAVTRRPHARVDVNEIVQQVLETIEPRRKELAELQGLQINMVSRLRKVRPISGSVSELREALTNVLFNAIEAMPQGGKLLVRTGVREDSVFIEVKDTGVGMPPEVQEKALQPFFTTKTDGMGLGLSLVYGTVKRHSGQVEISSQPGKGTTVTLLFPIDLSAGEVHEAAEPIITHKAAVLIVDDNIEVTRTLREMLESVSHEVSAVTDGQEGIERYQESKFDVVITDIGMPGISGLEVSKAIKACDPGANVILITAWGVELDHKQIKDSGASLVIQKPFDRTRILSAIEDLLSGSRKNRS